MNYQDYIFSDKKEIEQLLTSSKQEIRISAIIGMVNGISDANWVQNKLLELVNDENFWIAKSSITGLADLARIHGKLDLLKVKSILREVDRKDLKPIIEAALDDFSIFLNPS